MKVNDEKGKRTVVIKEIHDEQEFQAEAQHLQQFSSRFLVCTSLITLTAFVTPFFIFFNLNLGFVFGYLSQLTEDCT